VTIEKWQGVNAHPPGNTDAKIIAQCAALKKLKPSLSCIMYWDTNTVWDCVGAGPPGFCSGRNTENIAYLGAVTANLAPDKYLLKQPNGSLYVSSCKYSRSLCVFCRSSKKAAGQTSTPT